MNCCRNLTLLSDTRKVFSSILPLQRSSKPRRRTIRVYWDGLGLARTETMCNYLREFSAFYQTIDFRLAKYRKAPSNQCQIISSYFVLNWIRTEPRTRPQYATSRGPESGPKRKLGQDGLFEHNGIMFGSANDNIRCIIIYIKLYIRKTAFFQPSTQEKFNYNPIISFLIAGTSRDSCVRFRTLSLN